ncbi:MATE family efflux transporter [Exilibacterium tricleocarpae]|uniref:Multidrug-efflux transporter n=1 Tax=Exilibacterium tricleocarpae TaxID=2591008 RepID=A0A545TS67_9GAMM|nr:MATE family efflux transporter [Exilibacterium tricleocarpae]TQV80067.1 MATE family efflux transporter [Exilibacterium tricleocarpae]
MPASPTNTGTGIWSLAWPSIAVYLLNTLSGLAIIKIVSGLGTDGVAAVTAGTRVLFILQAVMMGLGAGATALISRAWGAGDRDDVALYTNLAMSTGVLITLLFSALIIAGAPLIADLFRLAAGAHSAAVSYIRWTMLFSVTFSINIVLATALRAAGDARTALYIVGGATVVYLPLSAALTYGWWGMPDWGISGTALGGGIAYALGSVVAVYLWIGNRLVIPFTVTPLARLCAQFKRLWHVAYPAMAEQGVMQLALFLFVWLISSYSTAAFAAYGIGLSLLSVTMVIGLGFSIAGSALVGQQLGAGNPAGAVAMGYRALRLALVAMTVFGVLAIVFARPLAAMMIDDPEVIRLTVVFLWCLGLAQPLLAVDFALGGALRGAGDTRFPLLSTFCGFILTRMVIAALFTRLGLPVEWVFATLIGDYLVKASMILWRFRSRRWLGTR